MKAPALTAVESLTACLWETASLSPRAMGIVRDLASVHGPDRVVVDSCQRLEYYGIGPCRCDAPHRLHGLEALHHLAEVASGLHAAELGEDQVMGQVREGVSGADGDLRALAGLAVAAARAFRRAEEFDTDSGRLLDRALQAAEVAPQGDLLVLGAGRLGRLVAERGAALGFGGIVVASRRPPDERWLQALNAAHVSLVDLHRWSSVDVVVGCLGATADPIDPVTELPPVTRLLVDLGSPRNFVRNVPTAVPLITIARIIEARSPGEEERRRRASTRLRQVLVERLAGAATDGASPLGRLRKNVEQIRRAEAIRLAASNPDLDPVAIDTMTRSLVNRLFHRPTEVLRDAPDLAAEIADLFEPGPGSH